MGKRYLKRSYNNNIHTSIFGNGLPSYGAQISHMGGVTYIDPALNVQHVKNVLISSGYTGTFNSNPATADYLIMPGTIIRASFSNGSPSITWNF